MNSPNKRPRPRRGHHFIEPQEYGRSVLGAPLEYWPTASSETDILIVAGVHGEEPDTTVILSKALRSLEALPERVACVTCANPDGTIRGTRGNARGVDLNRNFPTSDWAEQEVTHRWRLDLESEVRLTTGTAPASEPEVTALLGLVERLKPRQLITLHGPLECIDDPSNSPLANRIAKRTGMPVVPDVGYPTPGSFGTWAQENDLPMITWEFPPDSIEKMFVTKVPVLVDILRSGTC